VKPPRPPPALTQAVLHEAALAYLTRGAATAATLTRTLERRVRNWATRSVRAGSDPEEVGAAAARAREWVAPIVLRLVEVRLVDDAAFAAQRADRLTRGGRSKRAIAAHLKQKGVDGETARTALAETVDDDLGAALVLARKRRLGPFTRDADEGADARRRALGVLARAGFDFDTAHRALRMSRDEAEERIVARR